MSGLLVREHSPLKHVTTETAEHVTWEGVRSGVCGSEGCDQCAWTVEGCEGVCFRDSRVCVYMKVDI